MAESVYGCINTFGLVIKIIPSSVYLPNAFGPGVDDSLFDLKIFNRWGEQAFESNSVLNTWNETGKNGEIAAVGNYV